MLFMTLNVAGALHNPEDITLNCHNSLLAENPISAFESQYSKPNNTS